MIPDGLRTAVRHVFGQPVVAAQRLHGGDLSDVSLLTLEDGQSLVSKSGPLTAVESRMLLAIAQTGARSPQVLGSYGPHLFLEALPEAAPTPAGWRDLGQSLGQLHRTTGAHFGWQEDYAFGSVPIRNAPETNWHEFWGENRLRALSKGVPVDLRKRLDVLIKRLPELLPDPPKALLHGDLWVGNAVFTPRHAFLIDPACYFGDPEVDLAMLHLFATPPDAFWEGYGMPATGWQQRVPVYQLWPALVHLRLFGAGYVGMVESRLTSLGV
ncbi:aminoglycoside phosphotransferase [Rhodobacteraceae bacterium 4F10]|nr:aminoglycoside phosphotransferase [Rhodobacteraceae bacterium 4F10]